jgi:hypothetical protein
LNYVLINQHSPLYRVSSANAAGGFVDKNLDKKSTWCLVRGAGVTLDGAAVLSVLAAFGLVFLSCLSLMAGDAAPAATPSTATPAAVPATPPPAIANFAVELAVNKTTLAVGETITATVTYRWPAQATVVSADGEPDPARDFVHAFVTDLPPPQRLSTGQEERRVFRITLAAQRDGAWELPRPTLTIRHATGTSSTVAPAVVVQVGLESLPAQLPPARPAWTQAQAPNENTTAWWIVAIVVILSAGIALLAWNRRRTPIHQQTPWERFSDDWQAASAAADGKEAGARLSLGVRRCLGTVFRFDGPAATAKETLTFLRGRLHDHEHRDLTRLLEQIDALRWAVDDLAPSAVRPLLEQGRAWSLALQQRLDAEAEAAKQAKSAPTNNEVTTKPHSTAP